ncbi:glycosyl transferase family 2 [Mycolicibacterium mucogenicum 261Sha1.1M5]|nr:glycosyl transferase family 2 [Mycolicibacterium mucogenicum 261Sha1.1M5]
MNRDVTIPPLPAEPTDPTPEVSQASHASRASPTISVVIPMHNEARIIARCLRALEAQTEPADEIVVVDNCCTDRSAAIARRFPGVRVVDEPRPGVTFARTTGFDAARSDVIARIDADTIVPPDWIARLRSDFRDPTLDGQGGGAAIAELSPGEHLWFAWWYRGFRAWHQRSIGVRPMLYGFNSAFRRHAWLEARPLVGLGDEQVSEDVDVTIAMLRTGHRLRYAPDLIVRARLFRSIDRKKLSRYYETDSLTLARHRYGNRRRWAGRIT